MGDFVWLTPEYQYIHELAVRHHASLAQLVRAQLHWNHRAAGSTPDRGSSVAFLTRGSKWEHKGGLGKGQREGNVKFAFIFDDLLRISGFRGICTN